MTVRRILAAAAVVAASVPVAAALARPTPGFELTEERTQEAPGVRRQEPIHTWMVPGKVRKEEASSTVIIRDDLGLVWVLAPADKTYYTVTQKLMEEMGGDSMAALLPDQGEDPGKWLERTGRRKRVGSWDAYEVQVEDRPVPGVVLSLWLSADVGIDPEEYAPFGGGALGSSGPAGALLGGLRSLDGYPVEANLTMAYGGREFRLHQRLRRVEPAAIDDERFEIPHDYREVPAPFAATGAADERAGAHPARRAGQPSGGDE